jgi:hypothetical protein
VHRPEASGEFKFLPQRLGDLGVVSGEAPCHLGGVPSPDDDRDDGRMTQRKLQRGLRQSHAVQLADLG